LADRFELAQDFLASLKPGVGGEATPRVDLLDDQVTFQVGMTKLAGREAVVAKMAGPEADPIYRQVTWLKPERNGDAVQVVGLTPSGSPQGGVVLLLHVAADRIALIQQQAVPGAAPSPTELKLTPELKDLVDNALTTRHPILIVAVLENGQPILSYRGSTHVFGHRELALWSRHADGNFIRSIEKNPRVTLFYRDAATRTTLQFQGRARVVTDEPTRNRVYEGSPEPERNSDFARLGHAVVVELDRIEGGFNLAPGGRVLMVWGAGTIS